jgi:signal transduction histidine kinase
MTTTIAPVIPASAPVRAGGISLWHVWLVLGTAASVAYVFLPEWQDVMYPCFSIAAAVGMLIGVVRNRPARTSAFVALITGLTLQWCGDLSFFAYNRALGEVPYPSFADLFYVTSYVLFAAAFVILVRGRNTTRIRGALIDTAITITAFGLLEYVLLIQPNLWDHTQPLLARAVSTAYPVADIVVLGLLARLIVSPGSRTPSFRLLVVAFALMLGADSVYGTMMQYGLYDGGTIDICWALAFTFMGTAVLHPSVTTLAAPSTDAPPRLTNRRLAVLAVMTMIAPALFAVTARDALTLPLTLAISAGAVLLFLLVLARVAGLNHALESSVREVVLAQEARDHLLRQTLRSSEEQRSLIATELHDGPLQHLTALLYRLQAARKVRVPADEWDAKITSFQDAVSSEITNIRRMMTVLQPGALVERGLEGSLRDFVHESITRSETSCSVNVDLRERPSPDLETLIYRLAQESITEAARDGARAISVTVTDRDGPIELSIDAHARAGSESESQLEDDLRVFTARERVEMVGGEFAVDRSAGRTTLRARFANEVKV